METIQFGTISNLIRISSSAITTMMRALEIIARENPENVQNTCSAQKVLLNCRERKDTKTFQNSSIKIMLLIIQC